MLDEPEQKGGKINWPVAIGVSVVAHVLVLGFIWFVSSPSADATAEGTPVEETPVEETPVADRHESAPASGEERPSGRPSDPPSPVETVEYKVVSGDNLTKISQRNGCTVQDLRDLNALQSDDLRVGQVLKVPVRK
ncbi:MAG: LysM peptidoglycan-binding domain-containing protein [Kiritimatiellia bacterium]